MPDQPAYKPAGGDGPHGRALPAIVTRCAG